jgi:hypothetical protein
MGQRLIKVLDRSSIHRLLTQAEPLRPLPLLIRPALLAQVLLL